MNVNNLDFEVYLSEDTIKAKVKELASAINQDFGDKKPLFIPILNGSFIFAADLLREIPGLPEITFIKAKSYNGLSSSGKVDLTLDLEYKIENRHVVLVEDIIDSGLTIQFLKKHLQQFNPASITTVVLLLKPDVFKDKYPVEYVGFEIPNKFVIGYGLDFDGFGRSLKDIYQKSN